MQKYLTNAKYLGNHSNPYLVLVECINQTITSCEINNNTKFVCSNAFSDCRNLTSIAIPSSVTSIGDSAFIGCSSLTIYYEASSKPSGWDYYWNFDHCLVVWGYNE